ncbi:MAG: RNA polymerase sigma-70 factor [Bacteroidales bacterium]|nr:RNA polymerase sigma-70 factor [Bacteroidales bacterium]
MNDLALYSRVREGDIYSFETLFRRYYAPLCLYCNKIVGNIDTAEEVVQELFYTLWKDRAILRISRSAKSYLYGAVRNQSLQYLEHLQVRKRYYHKVVAGEIPANDPHDSPQEILEYKELEQRLEFALEGLPKRRRDIFRMNRFEGKKYEQIAHEMSLSVKTIESEMSKALHVLRKVI